MSRMFGRVVLSKQPGAFNPIHNTHVFMCGSPQMSEEMIGILTQEGFKGRHKKRTRSGSCGKVLALMKCRTMWTNAKKAFKLQRST